MRLAPILDWSAKCRPPKASSSDRLSAVNTLFRHLMADGFVDLHVHTTASDGRLSPTEAVRAAGYSRVAIDLGGFRSGSLNILGGVGVDAAPLARVAGSAAGVA